MFFVTNYADFKLIAAQFAGGKVFFCTAEGFKAWGIAVDLPVLTLSLPSQPGAFAADFPGAIQLTSGIMTAIG